MKRWTAKVAWTGIDLYGVWFQRDGHSLGLSIGWGRRYASLIYTRKEQ